MSEQNCSQKLWDLLREQAQLQTDTSLTFDEADNDDDMMEAFQNLKKNTKRMGEISASLTDVIRESLVTLSPIEEKALLYHQVLFASTKSVVEGFGLLIKTAFENGLLSRKEVQSLL